jgi:hypothetical protein
MIIAKCTDCHRSVRTVGAYCQCSVVLGAEHCQWCHCWLSHMKNTRFVESAKSTATSCNSAKLTGCDAQLSCVWASQGWQ